MTNDKEKSARRKAVLWENDPDNHSKSLPPMTKLYFKAELDKLGRMVLYARKGKRGRWGFAPMYDGEALEALVTALAAKKICGVPLTPGLVLNPPSLILNLRGWSSGI